MSLHLGAKPGDIAPTVLITGDPLRAKHYAENFLKDPVCYNQIRGMLGYTGTYKGKPVSIQGTGIGIPSTALYIHELIHSYDVKRIIRVGTCGALQKGLALGDIIAAIEAGTDSGVVGKFIRDSATKPQADPFLLELTAKVARELKLTVRCGPVFSTDLFYSEDSSRYDKSTSAGVLGVDMETSVLYAMGKRYGFQALSLLTVSDNLLTGEETTPGERERQANDMAVVALKIAVRVPES